MNGSSVAWKTWLLAAGGGLIAVVVVLALFRIPRIQGIAVSPGEVLVPAKVELAWQGNELLVDEVALRDPTPLFLPTQWNASEDALAMNAPREPGGSFQDYAPHYVFPENELRLEFRSKSEVPVKPADVFTTSKSDQALLGFGQVDRAVAPLETRGAYIEVMAASSGEVVMSESVMDRPPEPGTWQPLDFLVAVDAAGIVRPPVLTESSRVTDVDSYFKEYLIKVLHIGERLAPGFYRISIGP
jgi:hypothetical protein